MEIGDARSEETAGGQPDTLWRAKFSLCCVLCCRVTLCEVCGCVKCLLACVYVCQASASVEC
jgi:hypothetical protein